MFGWGKKGDESGPKDQIAAAPRKQSQGVPTVKFDSSKISEAIKSDLRQNVKLLTEVPPHDFDMIYEAALRSITAGRALDILCKALLTIDGMNKRRAADISLSLNNKASALMGVEAQNRNGITYAVWCYSGAPCGDIEQDTAHKAANGAPYLVKKGMFLNGQWTWPGRENGCKCISKPMIVGLDGHTGDKPTGYIE